MIYTQIVQNAYQGLLLILIFSAPCAYQHVFGDNSCYFSGRNANPGTDSFFCCEACVSDSSAHIMGTWLGSQIMNFSLNIFTNFPARLLLQGEKWAETDKEERGLSSPGEYMTFSFDADKLKNFDPQKEVLCLQKGGRLTTEPRGRWIGRLWRHIGNQLTTN